MPWDGAFFGKLRQRALHAFFVLRRPMTLGVRALVLDSENRVFLVRHGYLPGWHLPGGGVDPGETCGEALERELKEETNIELAGAPTLWGIFFNRRASKRDHVIVYVVWAFRLGAPRPPDWEICESGFFPHDALPEGATPATRRRLAEVLGGARISPEW
jgi:ADP-ribose pyrophosphatase YjhB (NUDIX family)